MEHDQDFSKLRNLLALRKLEMPMDTQVDQFLVELHRRQRVQLLRPASTWSRLTGWVQEKISGFELVPTLSYGSVAFAALAIAIVVGLSQQVQVTQSEGHPYSLSFRMSPHDSTFAMIPSSFTSTYGNSTKFAAAENFTPSRSDSATTRFVLANNSPRAHDATVAF